MEIEILNKNCKTIFFAISIYLLFIFFKYRNTSYFSKFVTVGFYEIINLKDIKIDENSYFNKKNKIVSTIQENWTNSLFLKR